MYSNILQNYQLYTRYPQVPKIKHALPLVLRAFANVYLCNLALFINLIFLSDYLFILQGIINKMVVRFSIY